MVYYIDPQNGSDSNAGTIPEMPWCTITGRVFEPGDQVLFRRGSVIRKALRLPGGSREGVITYGAYGDGPDPVVNPSVNAGKKELWTEERPGIWRFAGSLPGEMCNIVFNDGASFGNLRWSHTGGQSSKSTPTGAVAQFAAGGKEVEERYGFYRYELWLCIRSTDCYGC